MAICGVLMAGQALRIHFNQPPTHGMVTSLLAVALAAGIALEYRQILGKDPGLALLAGLLCLKQFEVRSGRDLRAAIFLALFLQFGLFFRSQDIPTAALALLGTWAGLAALVSQRVDDGLKIPARYAGALLLQGLPVMVLLFVLFPRVQGPLWGLPEDTFAAKTGLSDSMTPGSIGELVQSDAIALRARFAGAVPPPEQRYWRGPVLDSYDGRTWRPGNRRWSTSPAYQVEGKSYRYELTLEPLEHPWLLALDFPAAGIPNARYGSNLQLVASQPIRNRTRLTVTSYPETSVGLQETPENLDLARQLPKEGETRSRALAQSLRARSGSDRAVLQATLDYFRQAGLLYTLTPRPLSGDPVDSFLFETRQGFCEHFAASFVFLMRAAGVPARVVTGYLGGEINPVDQVMVIRQSDAHAWAEVWLDQQGWVRVDPTALAAPLRQSAGLAQALPFGEPLPFMLRGNLDWLRSLRNHWEAFNHSWDRWVLGYTPERQLELLSRLGLGHADWKRLAIALAGGFCLVMLGLLAWHLRPQRRLDPLDREWHRFCRRLAARGIGRLPWEGPIAYAERASLALPQWAPAIAQIARRYATLRYGPGAPSGEFARFQHDIRTFQRP